MIEQEIATVREGGKIEEGIKVIGGLRPSGWYEPRPGEPGYRPEAAIEKDEAARRKVIELMNRPRRPRIKNKRVPASEEEDHETEEGEDSSVEEGSDDDVDPYQRGTPDEDGLLPNQHVRLARKQKEELQAVFKLINSFNNKLDRNKRSEYFIGEDHADNAILLEMEKSANIRLKSQGKKKVFKWTGAQRESIGRLRQMEIDYRGWLLGSDPGTGKTAMSIGVSVVKPEEGPTIVISPSIGSLQQWEDEIYKLRPGCKVIMYHGNNTKGFTAFDMQQADYVLCTYSRLRSEYSDMHKAHLDYIARRKDPCSWKRNKEGYKLKSDLYQIMTNIKDTIPQVDISVIRPNCPLLAVKWVRSLLDEGHSIKNHIAEAHKAAMALNVYIRCLLTGTPFCREYHDLSSYFAFLRIWPLNDPGFFRPHFIIIKKDKKNVRNKIALLKGVRSAVLHLALGSVMVRHLRFDMFEGEPVTGLTKPIFQERAVELDNGGSIPLNYPFDEEKYHENSIDQLKNAKRYLTYRDKRVKDGENASIRDSEISSFFVHKESFENFLPTTEAMTQYPSRSQHDNLIRAHAERKKLKFRLKEVLSVILLGCIGAASWVALTARYSAGNDEDDEFHRGTAMGKALLALTKGITAKNQKNRRARFRRLVREEGCWRSSKILQCIEDIKSRRTKTKGKGLIFSQFLSILDVIEVALQESGITFLRYDGSISPKQKQVAIEKFESGKFEVLLLTIASGGQSLNLQDATSIYILTPNWGPAMDEQAIARALRLGQEEDVWVFFYFAPYSMDDRFKAVRVDKISKQNSLLPLFSTSGINQDGEAALEETKTQMEKIQNCTFTTFVQEVMPPVVLNTKALF
jgi:superfamily II DNA or RNA helicase